MDVNDITHAVLSSSVQVFFEHDHYKSTADTMEDFTVLYGRFSYTVCRPPFYSIAASRVA